MKRLQDWLAAYIDRGGKRAFALHSLLVAFGMLFMWPRMLWLALKALNEWIHDTRPAAILLMLLAPFFFWAAPLIVWLSTTRSKSFEDDL